MKHGLILCNVALIIVAILLVGCGGNTNTTPAASNPASVTGSSTSASVSSTTSQVTSTTSTPATTPASTPGSDKAIADILGKISGISSFQYEAVATSPAGNMTQKTWVKKNKMKVETTTEGLISITFIDMEAKTMVNYMPAQKIAIKMDFSQAPKSSEESNAAILKSNPKVIGVETIDGKVCTIIEYTSPDSTTKAWIWQENGLSIRVESTTPMGKVTINMQNISFNDIPDNVFELPAGVQVMGMPVVP